MSPRSIALYLGAGRQLVEHLAAHDGPTDPAELERSHVEAFLADYATTHKPATVSIVFRALQQFGTWLADEEDLDRSPLTARPDETTRRPGTARTRRHRRADQSAACRMRWT